MRLHDNRGLDAALSSGFPVLPLFVFDTDILGKLRSRRDKRVLFIYRELTALRETLLRQGALFRFFHGRPADAFRELLTTFPVHAVYVNRDYEPGALQRDREVELLLRERGVVFVSFKDQVVFERGETAKEDGTPYTVYTPYRNRWRKQLSAGGLDPFPSLAKTAAFMKAPPLPMPALEELGFEDFDARFPGRKVSDTLLENYEATRDFPALEGTSHLGIHLRFGTVSIRELTRQALGHGAVFLDELIWRNFFMDILAHFPYVAEGPFKKKYAFIRWRNNEAEFSRWCNGETGFPIVDAGMRELNATGTMHNRVRMITASFLAKQLLIDWRWGEAWFADKLLDFELASNNGNWQWAAGCGCDAAPYFRVFNPLLQQQKYDPRGEYVNKWVPEAGTSRYPDPMTDLAFARDRSIKAYRLAVGGD